MSGFTDFLECDAAHWDFVIEMGATWQRVLTLNDVLGNPVDLTGYTAKMDIRQTPTTFSPLFQLTSGGGSIAMNSSGQVTLLIAATYTVEFEPGNYVYDLFITDGSSRTAKIVEGNCLVEGNVTI